MRRGRPRARRVEPAEVVRASDTLTEPDYVDAFRIDRAHDSRSAEQWARATFEGAPTPIRSLLLIGWRLVLRLQLGPRPSGEHVLGWTMLSATPQEVVLGVRSPILGTAHLLLRLDRAHITLATFIRFERPGARVLWSIVGLIHRQTLPRLLERAARAREPGSPARN